MHLALPTNGIFYLHLTSGHILSIYIVYYLQNVGHGISLLSVISIPVPQASAEYAVRLYFFSNKVTEYYE